MKLDTNYIRAAVTENYFGFKEKEFYEVVPRGDETIVLTKQGVQVLLSPILETFEKDENGLLKRFQVIERIF